MIKDPNLKPKSFLIDQPVRSNFQIIIRPHNAYFLKKVIFGEKIDKLIKMIILEKIQISTI